MRRQMFLVALLAAVLTNAGMAVTDRYIVGEATAGASEEPLSVQVDNQPVDVRVVGPALGQLREINDDLDDLDEQLDQLGKLDDVNAKLDAVAGLLSKPAALRRVPTLRPTAPGPNLGSSVSGR